VVDASTRRPLVPPAQIREGSPLDRIDLVSKDSCVSAETSPVTSGTDQPRRPIGRSAIAWGLVALSAAALLVSFGLSVALGTWDPQDGQLAIPAAIGLLAMSLIGALIASRTGNAIGWIFLAIPTTFWVSQLAQDLADHAVLRGAGYAGFAYWLSQWPFFLSLLLLASVFFLFPTGRLPSRRWRWVWRAYVTSGIVTIVGFAIQPYRYQETPTGMVVTNPVGIGWLEAVLGPVLAVAGFTLLACGFLSFASLVVRYRAADAEGRQQLRWLFAVGGFSAVCLLLGLVFGPLGDAGVAFAKTLADVLMTLLVALLAIGIPMATVVAVFRYHLYDLSVVIRKTVVYALLVGFVTIVYAGVVAGLSGLVGGDSLVLSIVATGIVAALFQPVRRWATRLANRLVFGRRAEPYQVLSRFSERVGGTYADEDVLPRMARVIAEGTGAECVELWLATGDDLHVAASWPADADPIAASDRVVKVRHQGRILGEIRIRKPANESLAAAEDKLLQDLASQAGVVVRNVGLMSELQERVDELSLRADELRASRARIVAAHDAERRRLERNIHDGAQQHLVALAVKLRLAKSLAASGRAEEAGRMLLALGDQAELARATLLDLASGIYPATLEERGIAAALEEQARAAGAPVAVDAAGVERLSIETEAAVYFVCLEAMQNAQKYARASHVDVRLARDDGDLAFEVRDDGVGFDGSGSTGSGLQNMRDRLSALGGEVEIRSTPGAGTTVRGRVPLQREVVP
jgi:signal transduction histidine kinase